MRYSVPSFACSKTRFEAVDVTIISFAKLDACVPTVMSCLRGDESEIVGGHQKKVYNITFSYFLLVSFAQPVHQVGASVEQWCLKQVTVFSLTLDTD